MTSPLYVPDSHLRLVPRPDGTLSVSLSEHLVTLLGRPQWVECQAGPGDELSPGVPFASVETGKTVYEAALPFPAVFVELNEQVRSNASLLALPKLEAGWLCKVRPAADGWREGLLDEAGYVAYIAP